MFIMFLSACSQKDSDGTIPGTVDVPNFDNVSEIKFNDIEEYPVGLYR